MRFKWNGDALDMTKQENPIQILAINLLLLTEKRENAKKNYYEYQR